MFDEMSIRQDFPMLKGKQMQGHELIYFDNGATTFKPYAVMDAVNYYCTDITCNAHRGDYDLSFQVDTAYEGARKRVAEFLHADTKEIVFTSGASEGLNLIAYGFGRKFLQKGDVVLSTEAEHASTILPWMRACEECGASLQYIPLDEEGRIDLTAFSRMMSEQVRVIALAQITNVLGYVVPIKEITEIAHAYGAYVVVDGAQSVPHMPVDVKELDCDFLCFSAHKMCGPTGIGAMYGKYELLEAMDPLFLGGGSNARFDMCGNLQMKHAPFKFESGTPNIEGVLGMKAAIDYLDHIGMDRIHRYEHELHDYMVSRMLELDNVEVYNPTAESGILTFNIKNVFAQDGASYFNANGIAVRSGQHCAKLLMEKLNTSATIRASLYFYNTKEEVDHFLAVCANANMHTCLDVFF